MQSPHDIQPVFQALADPTRRAILAMLRETPKTIGEVAAEFEMSRPAVAKHLKVLQAGDLIRVRSQGRSRINTLNPTALKKAQAWFDYFDAFWDEKLANLKLAVENENG